MITITDNDYRNIARSLIGKIAGSDFFNGTVEYDTLQFSSHLSTTLIIYREQATDRAERPGAYPPITDIVPVWWEYHLFDQGGEQLTDFSWRQLMEALP